MDLQERWLSLWERCGAHGNPLKVWGLIEENYTRAGRFYHTLSHVEDMLTKLDSFLSAAPKEEPERNYWEWAIFFHDLEYEVSRNDNEEKSASASSLVSSLYGLVPSFAERVSELILATRHQGTSGLDYEQTVMVELDLSILGSEKEVFDQYERNVFREYVEFGGIDPEGFRAGRKAILESFLKRKPLFSIGFFHHHYEEKARENLQRSISALS